MNIIECLDDPDALGPWFAAPSWNAWRTILKAAFALPMTPEDVEIFGKLAGGRAPPTRKVRELVIAAGRRGGKDSAASAVATWAASCVDYRGLLRPGENALVTCLAVDRQQARVLLSYVRGYFNSVPMLRAMVVNETADGFILSNEVEVAISTNNFRSVRGRTIALAVFDEAAFWRDERSASPDFETYNAVLPGMATLAPDSMLIIISSPFRKAGLLHEKWRQHFGRNDDDVLVIQAASRDLNPVLDPKIIEDALAADPAAAASEWLGQWRDDIAAFISRDLIDAAVEVGRTVRPPVEGIKYRGFCDPSGGVGDAMVLAIAHSEGPRDSSRVILDCLLERRPPFNPSEVTREMAGALKSYGVGRVEGDRYAAQWVVEAFRQNGITYKHSERDRSQIYIDVLPLLTTGRATLLDNRRLITQFVNLERRTSSSGKERIDHPSGPGSADDCANASAGALTLAASGRLRCPSSPPVVPIIAACTPPSMETFE